MFVCVCVCVCLSVCGGQKNTTAVYESQLSRNNPEGDFRGRRSRIRGPFCSESYWSVRNQ